MQIYNSSDLLLINSASATDANGVTYTNPFSSNVNPNDSSTIVFSNVISDAYGDSIVLSNTETLNNNVWTGSSTFVDSNGDNIPLLPAVPQAPDWLALFGPSYTNSSTAGCPTLPPSVLYQPATSSATWTPPSGSGAGNATYLFCYALVYTRSGLPAFDPIHFFGNDDDEVKLQSVVLPDKTAWIFSYNSADPNNPNSLADGALNNVILPTGGQVSYTYHSHLADVTTSCAQAPSFGGFGGGPVCGSSGLITSVIGSRSTNDNLGNIATWNYDIGTITYDTSPSAVGYLPRIGVSTTHGPVIQQPDGTFASNDIVDTYTGALGSGGIPMTLQKEDIYQGPAGGQNLPIETTTHSYLLTYGQTGQGYNEFVASYLPSIVSATLPGVGTSVTTTRYDASFVGSSSFIDQNCNNPPDCTDLGPENIQTATYSLPLGTVTSESVTDFNPLAVLTSTQTVPYWMTTGGTASPYYQANLINLPGSIKNLNVISGETDYAYDESNGSPQGAFGNLTTRKQFPNMGGPPLTASTVYTSQGVPSQVTVNGVVTQVNSFDCNGRYPLSTTVGFGTSIAETTLQQHDCGTGAIISSTDPNGVLTYNLYNDPLNRITQVSSAVGTNLETHIKYTYSANQVQIAQDQNAKDDGLIQTTSMMDGLGRVIKQTQPTGAAIDTHYDLIGHLSSVSNPYFTTTDPTFDLTTYTYDALGRQLLTSHASDGSSSSISYAQQGNTQSGVKTVKTDEVGVATTFYNDALGRLSSVIEPGSLLTTYQYDGLGNPRNVMEYGAAHEIPRSRGFGYDSLSRLLYSSNPETGVIC